MMVISVLFGISLDIGGQVVWDFLPSSSLDLGDASS